MHCPVCFSSYVSPGSNNSGLTEKKQLKCLHFVCADCFKKENFACPTCIDRKVSQMGLKPAGSAQAQAARVVDAFAATVADVNEMGTFNRDE